MLNYLKKNLVYPEIIEKQNILNSLSIKDQPVDHVIKYNEATELKQVYIDTEFFECFTNNNSNTVFNSIDNTILAGSKIALKNLLSSFTDNASLLEKRQQLLDLIDTNYISAQLSNINENTILYWLNNNSYADELYDIVYFSNWFLKKLNNVPTALSIKNIYRIVLSPMIGILSPIVYAIIPYLVLIFKFKIKMNFSKYIKLMFKFFNNAGAADLLFGGGGSAFKYIRILSSIFSFVFYFQGLFNSVEIAKTLYKTSKHIINIIDTVLAFKKNATDLICNYPVDLSCYNINIGSISTVCNVSDNFCLNFGKKLHTFKNLDKKCISNILLHVYYIDALNSLKLFQNKYVNTSYGGDYYLQGLCHPCLKHPVENDWNISNSTNAIITSGNSSGKSILIKSLLINTLLSQTCGISCCTEHSSFTPFKYILSCIHVPDVTGHASLFEAEMHRSKYILDTVKEEQNTLIIMDEIFNSTNPLEAIAGAYAVCKKISEYKNVILVFTTHLSYLTKLSKTGKFVNYRMQTIVDGKSDTIEFTYKLEKGINKHYIALELLKKNGFDSDIIEEAIAIKKHLST